MSRYLEAKRKLLFAIATVKYIRLVMTNNKLITKDEVEAFTREALKIYMQSSGEILDQAELSRIIQTCVFEIKDKIQTSDSVTLQTKNLAYIDSSSIMQYKNIVELGNANSNQMQINEKLNINDINVIDYGNSNTFNVDSKFEVLDIIDFSIIHSTLIKVIDNFIVANHYDIKLIESQLLSVQSLIESKSFMTLELSELISIPLYINDIFYLYDEQLELYKPTSVNMEILEQNSIKDTVVLLDDESRVIASNKIITLSDYVKLGRYQYTLLKQIKNMDVEEYYENSITSTIYIEQ